MKKGYYWLPDELIDKHGTQLGLSGIGLYSYLARRADKHGRSYPGLKRICKDTGIGSENTIRRYLTILKDLQILKVWKVNGKFQYQILIQQNSQNKDEYTQKVNLKEYTSKEYTKKELDIDFNKNYAGRTKTLKALKEKNPEAYSKLYGNNNENL